MDASPPLPPVARARPPGAVALLALAPLPLRNHRRVFYVGDDLCVSLEQVTASDCARLVRLYAFPTQLLSAIADPGKTKWSRAACRLPPTLVTAVTCGR